MREIDADTCEMKRMYVCPEYHGRGSAVLFGEAARTEGYSVMRLDTSIRQAEVQALYRRLGFREAAPYSSNPLGIHLKKSGRKHLLLRPTIPPDPAEPVLQYHAGPRDTLTSGCRTLK